MPCSNISIALCTYNGARFLPDLLCSLSRQTLVPNEIVICDDASSDSTMSCIDHFLSHQSIPVKVIENKKRLGFLKNYSRAISYCTGDYVALCDQDDIWLPKKLELTMQKMKDAEAVHGSRMPLLVHTDLRVIDSSGRVIAESFTKQRRLQSSFKKPLNVLLVQNFVTGCTALMNRSLIEAALPISENAVFHDWWLALFAAAKGEIIFEPSPTVLYRLHDNNVIGSKGFYTPKNIGRITKLRVLEKDVAFAVDQVRALKERLVDQSDQRHINFLEDYLRAFYRGGYAALSMSLIHGIQRMGFIRNILFSFLLLKSGYKRYLKSK